MNELPSNVYAERIVLGCLMRAGHRWIEFGDALQPADFSLDKHRLIWSHMASLAQRGDPIDHITLLGEFDRSGQLETIGGLPTLATLTDGVPDVPNLPSYIALVREAAMRRRAILLADQIQKRAASADYSVDQIGEMLRAASTEMSAPKDSEFLSIEEIIEANGGINSYVSRRIQQAIPYPWMGLNEHTGGMRPGQLIVIAAETGGGKTAFVGNIAQHVATNGYGVALFSLEMSQPEVCDRQLALAGRFNSRVFKYAIHDATAERIMDATGRLAEARLWISEGAGLTISKLIGSVERLRSKRRVDLVIVDYLQLMSGRGQSIVEQTANVARGLKNAAVELRCPIIALSQFAKAKQGEQRQGADLKYGSELSQAANLILILDGEKRYLNSPAEWLEWQLLIDKQRDGEAPLKLDMLWRKDCGLFMEAGGDAA